jgi:hypothetical protein
MVIEPKQATYWQAQLVDGTVMRGGQRHYYPNQPIVEMVPAEAIKVFAIAHNTFTDQYYQPWDQWYLNRVASTPTYPMVYRMADGSILTVNQDSITGVLKLTQDYSQTAIV